MKNMLLPVFEFLPGLVETVDVRTTNDSTRITAKNVCFIGLILSGKL